MNKEIIFLLESILSKRDYERYKFNDFIQSGYDVRVLDLTSFNNEDYKEEVDIYEIAKEIVYSPSSKKEILDYIKRVDKNSLIISLSRVNNKTLFIYRNLFKKGNKVGFINLGTTPDVYKSLKKRSPRSVLRKIKNIIIQKFFGVQSHFYIVGSKADILKAENHILFSKQSSIINYNSLDYDLYLRNEKQIDKSTTRTKYVVFLDEDNLNHPDNNITGIVPVDKDYYLELNKFFLNVENKYSVKVVVAAHPRSRYDKISNPFQGREILKFKSIELIKHSEFVLAHASTALSMAVIYKKPIIFLSSRSYHSTYIRAIKFSAEALAGIIIDLSLNNYILPDSLEINNIAYDDFIEYYLNYKNPNNIPLVKLIQDYYTSF